MQLSRTAARLSAIAIGATIAATFSANLLRAQETEETVVRNHVTVSDADREAATKVLHSSFHVMAAGLPGAKERAEGLNKASAKRLARADSGATGAETARAEATLTKPFFYPADLIKGKGPTLKTAVSHAVYINGKGKVSSEWGNPEGFLTDLFKSTFIHLADQYTGSTTDNYTVGKNATVSYPLYGGANVIYEHELWAIVHSVIVSNKSDYPPGLGHIYDLFLPNGIDTCFDAFPDCYAANNIELNFTFCAYHENVNFSDIGTVLITVIPYQNIDGCGVSRPSTHGELADSTNSVVSHETFETITDPEPDSGWTAENSLDELGFEVADECQPNTDDNGNFLVPTFKINGVSYAVQLEYSNTYHACAAQP